MKQSAEEAFMLTDDFFESMMETKREMDEESDVEDFEHIEMDDFLSDDEEKEDSNEMPSEVELVHDFGQVCYLFIFDKGVIGL